MAEYIWKHLPYAVYMDTNGLRSAGPSLNKPWVNELLAVTNKYGISLCICELVLHEWCEHIFEILTNNMQKLVSANKVLKDYNIDLPDIELKDVELPAKHELIKIVTEKLETSGFKMVKNWDAPLSQLLAEAVIKKPPFETGGKGLCDAVILESYAKHAKENFPDARVIVISKDAAVRRSMDRFSILDVIVIFLDESEIIDKLKALLKDEVATFIKEKNSRLKNYILGFETEIIDYVKQQPFEITDWMIDGPFTKEEDRINGSIEKLISVRPIKITNVIGDVQPYGEEKTPGRYPVQVYVEIEIDLVVKQYGFGLYRFKAATVQPNNVTEKSPVFFEDKSDYSPKLITKTIKRSVTVFATLDAEKEEKDILDDFKIIKIN
jgi:hypothetical protein